MSIMYLAWNNLKNISCLDNLLDSIFGSYFRSGKNENKDNLSTRYRKTVVSR